MERVQRAADSPMRAILEAAKLRRRIEGESPAELDAGTRRANGPRALTAEPPRPEVPRATFTGNAGVLAQGVANTPPAARGAATAGDAAVVTIRTLADEALPAAPARSAALAPAALAPLRSVSTLALPGEVPRLSPWPVASSTPAAPELVQMVEPEMTPRLQDLLQRSEVAVEFVIQPDGRVSGVQVLPPVPRALVPVIVAAVEQWRYAPVPAARAHRVQLVFKTGAN